MQHNLLHPVCDDQQRPPIRAARGVLEPQVASVGLTEAEAGEQGIDYRGLGGRTTETPRLAGRWRTPTTSSRSSPTRLQGPDLGAHLIGPQASSLIQPLIQAMSFGLTARRRSARPVLDPSGDGRGDRERPLKAVSVSRRHPRLAFTSASEVPSRSVSDRPRYRSSSRQQLGVVLTDSVLGAGLGLLALIDPSRVLLAVGERQSLVRRRCGRVVRQRSSELGRLDNDSLLMVLDEFDLDVSPAPTSSRRNRSLRRPR